jgi:hypothetical protein
MLNHPRIIFFKNSMIILLTLLLVSVSNESIAQVNNANIVSKSDRKLSISNKDMPKFNETGNEEEDIKNYKKAKENFKANNAEKIIKPAAKKNTVNNAANLKPHYILSLNSSAKQKEEIYINALSQYAGIENFRLIEKRRIIQLANGDGKIELFSSNELNQLYGRRIRPKNLKDEIAKPDIELLLNEHGIIKEQLKK